MKRLIYTFYRAGDILIALEEGGLDDRPIKDAARAERHVAPAQRLLAVRHEHEALATHVAVRWEERSESLIRRATINTTSLCAKGQ